MAKSGICYLAGAGPGDPGLVTLRTREVIETAEVIVYDYLCNPEILAWAPPEAERVYAGKKAGAHTLPQEEIERLLIARTRAGKRVVRLKGGDPFLFGRGGEEAEALAEAGLPFEVIPGVSSALAVPACAGIPLTHRAHNAQVTIFTGHGQEEAGTGAAADKEPALDYAALARGPGTKVMLMGVERLEAITTRLLEEGGDPALPVALIRWGSTARQQTLRGVLGDIARKAKQSGFSAPAVAVFGSVATLGEKLNWFEARPLFGRRVVVTRSRRQAGALTGRLRALGADVYELPTIRIEPPADRLAFGELVRDAHQYEWLVFTSPNGVTEFFDLFYKIYDDAREIGGARIAALGPATAARLKAFRLHVDLQPEDAVAEALVRAFTEGGSVENQRILVIRPETARDLLSRELTKKGAIVDEAVAYRTVPETDAVAQERFRAEGADLITFTSSSTVENFMALQLPLPPGLRTASIGPVTSKTMRAHGLRVDVEAKRHDLDGLEAAVRRYFSGSREQA